MGKGIWGIVSAFAFCLGIYALYSFIIMKTRGEINKGFLLGRKQNYQKCTDKAEYMKKTGTALLVLGIGGVVYAVVDVIHLFVCPIQTIDDIVLLLFFAVLVWFGWYTVKLRGKYWTDK